MISSFLYPLGHISKLPEMPMAVYSHSVEYSSLVKAQQSSGYSSKIKYSSITMWWRNQREGGEIGEQCERARYEPLQQQANWIVYFTYPR
jgi:hypothetical protein